MSWAIVYAIEWHPGCRAGLLMTALWARVFWWSCSGDDMRNKLTEILKTASKQRSDVTELRGKVIEMELERLAAAPVAAGDGSAVKMPTPRVPTASDDVAVFDKVLPV